MRRTLAAVLLLIAIFGLAACNLQVMTAPTPTPFNTPAPFGGNENVQINFVTATPFGNPALTGTPDPSAGDLSDPDPATTPDGGNIADWFVNNVIIPVWNFLYTFVGQALVSTWDFAGERGGFIAQVLCCIIPFILGSVFLVRYVLSGRRRRSLLP